MDTCHNGSVPLHRTRVVWGRAIMARLADMKVHVSVYVCVCVCAHMHTCTCARVISVSVYPVVMPVLCCFHVVAGMCVRVCVCAPNGLVMWVVIYTHQKYNYQPYDRHDMLTLSQTCHVNSVTDVMYALSEHVIVMNMSCILCHWHIKYTLSLTCPVYCHKMSPSQHVTVHNK